MKLPRSSPPVNDHARNVRRGEEMPVVSTKPRSIRPRAFAVNHSTMMSWSLTSPSEGTPGRVIEYFVDENWVEHQRRLERFSAFDAGLREQRLAFHLSEEAPRVKRYIGQSLDALGDLGKR